MKNNDIYYTLEKLDIQSGKHSKVRVGYKQNGDLRLGTKDREVLKDVSLEDVKEDMQVLVTSGLNNYIVTSPISEILEVGEDYIKFKTRTSTYLILEKEAE